MTVSRVNHADSSRVWDVLADAWTYSQWVVGNSRIRAVDDHWPAPGARILHSIGIWPAVINDETVVERCVPGAELELLAKVRPVLAARITLRTTDDAGGCRVEMTEVAATLPWRLLPVSVQLAAAGIRNRECLSRLAMVAERHVPLGEESDN